jgi:hypothetical protein
MGPLVICMSIDPFSFPDYWMKTAIMDIGIRKPQIQADLPEKVMNDNVTLGPRNSGPDIVNMDQETPLIMQWPCGLDQFEFFYVYLLRLRCLLTHLIGIS